MCAIYCIEDIINVISQSTYYQKQRTEMYEQIFRKCPKAEAIFEQKREIILYYLLGREIPSFDEDEMVTLWCISGNMISRMHRKTTADRIGVG